MKSERRFRVSGDTVYVRLALSLPILAHALGCGRFGFETTQVVSDAGFDAEIDSAPMDMMFTSGEAIAELTADGFESDDATLPPQAVEKDDARSVRNANESDRRASGRGDHRPRSPAL